MENRIGLNCLGEGDDAALPSLVYEPLGLGAFDVTGAQVLAEVLLWLSLSLQVLIVTFPAVVALQLREAHWGVRGL